MLVRRKLAGNTLEYAVLIAISVAALLSMDSYIKRSIQAKFKKDADKLGKQFSPYSTYELKSDAFFREQDTHFVEEGIQKPKWKTNGYERFSQTRRSDMDGIQEEKW